MEILQHYNSNRIIFSFLANLIFKLSLAKEYRQKRNSPLHSAVMDVIMRANHDVIEEAKNMCDAIRELFADELEEGVKRGIQLGKEQGLEQGLKQGLEQGIQALILDNLEDRKTKEQIIVKLVKRFELSPESAETYYNKYGNITVS